MTTFETTGSNVLHMQKDLFIPGNILYSEPRSLKTIDGGSNRLVVGEPGHFGYSEGVGIVDCIVCPIESYIACGS